MLGVSGLAAGQSIVQVGHRCSTKVQPVLGDRDNPGVPVVGIFSVSGEYVSKPCTQRARDASAREAAFSSLTRNRHVDSLHSVLYAAVPDRTAAPHCAIPPNSA